MLFTANLLVLFSQYWENKTYHNIKIYKTYANTYHTKTQN